MIIPSLKNKQVKDYKFGDSLVVFEPGSEVARAVKSNKLQLTVYGIANALIDPQTFPLYNNEYASQNTVLFPTYYEIVRSQNFVYMIFQKLERPHVQNSASAIQHFIQQLQKILNSCALKIIKQSVFQKQNGKHELCIIVPYNKNQQKTSNLYGKFHNKSILAELFCDLVQCKDKKKVLQTFVQFIESKQLFHKIQPYLNLPSNVKNSPPVHQTVMKSQVNKFIKQAEEDYPQIDDKQYEELMAYVHVNPNLKKQANETFIRQSAQNRKDQAQQEIVDIVDNVSTSIFNITTQKSKSGKSKVEIKLNPQKLQAAEFQVHFQALLSTFKLFKQLIRSFLNKYRNGFAGIIAAYLLTLIYTLRRLQVYVDLANKVDVFELGSGYKKINTQKFANQVRRDIAKDARNLVNLKNIIENANMPYKTYEALMPFLDDNLENVDLAEAENFCFYYMTVLLRMSPGKTQHQILVLQLMYVLISPLYSLVYSEEQVPKNWDENYFELKKILISTQVPNWNI